MVLAASDRAASFNSLLLAHRFSWRSAAVCLKLGEDWTWLANCKMSRLTRTGLRSVSTRRELRGITAPTASHNGRNVALAVPTRLFLSPSRPSLERVSYPRLLQ